MLPRGLLCIHPTGVPSNKLPQSIWLPWAFFHYPGVCLQSHVGKLHLYLCQWKKFPSGNISRNQGKDLSNLLRSKEVTAGFPLPCLPLSPSPAKKCVVCFPKDYPSALCCLLRGSLWTALGHVGLHTTDKLVLRVPQAPQLPSGGNKEGQVGMDLGLLLAAAPRKGSEKEPGIQGLLLLLFSSLLSAQPLSGPQPGRFSHGRQ